ncbi:MAG TPA: 4-phosphoerythronate dehydrogenase PdxB [Petrimonas sp.]|uniref:4-phosphoerythronate dehydrogenase PdxB n=1 Tax=Petrimonas sp. TaxID=2023866 RepID=UPI0017752555|nr:4-phosphoerythronate dehydrogenase PdxB [Petrimonas sp.]
MKILADAHIPYLKGIAEQFGEVEYLPGDQFTKETISDKDALIVRTVTHFGKDILEGTNVKLICSATIGFDHIDTGYCDAQGIAWRTAPGCNANSVEQYVTASLLYLADKYRFDLKEKTIGIVGVGNVGSKVETACRKLGMQVLLNDPPRQEREAWREGEGAEKTVFVDLETIKKEADIITLHTPLTKTGRHKTYHLADEHFFDTLDKKPFIINSCRGGVADNVAMKKALKSGKISGAVIDCWENEPGIDRELLQMADIATPHIAGYSADGKWTATKMSLENLNEFFGSGIRPIKLMSLPQPENRVIDLKEIAPNNQLAYAVWQTYNPMVETVNLKANPGKFYQFRSNYPLRREYYAYELKNADSGIMPVLRELGFNV